jgi:hypothetical protein
LSEGSNLDGLLPKCGKTTILDYTDGELPVHAAILGLFHSDGLKKISQFHPKKKILGGPFASFFLTCI